jgi:L-serine dehydratase
MNSIREIYKYGYGPSSSHTIGPTRAAEFFLERNRGATSFSVELYGSLAATGKGHQTDRALLAVLGAERTEILWKPETVLPEHPNGMVFKAFTANKSAMDSWTVFSVGGGDLEDREGRLPKAAALYSERSLAAVLDTCRQKGFALWEYVFNIEDQNIELELSSIWQIMKQCIKNGLENEGVLPGPLKVARKAASYFIRANTSSSSTKSIGLLFTYALAVAEENSAGGKVVTAPTCGSAGVLPAVLYFLQQDQQISDQRIIKGLATAGLIGNLVKTNASISGAEVGCQGEIGTACSMAAAAAAQILGGTPAQIEYAAEMGMEHNLGLTCDPVGGYVQIPCIERNAIAAGKAYECAMYSLYSDGRHKISFDQVVETMRQTGTDMQAAYRETGAGGLAKHTF